MRTFKMKAAGVLLGVWFAFSAWAQNCQNCCIESTSTNAVSCTPGQITSFGALNFTATNVCAGNTIIAPQLTTGVTISQATQVNSITYNCNTSLNHNETNLVAYNIGALYFTPTNFNWPASITGPFNTPGTYVYRAQVNGTPSGSSCSTIVVTVAMVTITVTSSPPVIITQPTSQTVAVGNDVTFTAAGSGCPSVTYQWWFNATNSLLNATSSSLTITNVQTTNAGNYTVVLTNPSGSVTSAVAVLTVVLPACTNLSGIVAWWPAETNANDRIGTNNGVLNGNVTYTNGKVGEAFNFDGASYVQVSDSPSLHFTNVMTVEAWVNLRTFVGANSREIVSKFAAAGLAQNVFTLAIDPATQKAYYVINSSNNTGNAQVFSATAIPTNRWVHLAGVCDGTAVRIYVNGQLSATTAWTRGIFPGNQPLTIGCTMQSSPTSYFNGLIDEATLYNRALSAGEIQAIYNSSYLGKCPPAPNLPPIITVQPAINQTVNQGENATFSVVATGSAPLTYQWQFNAVNIPNATGDSYTRFNVQSADAGNYRVIVANSAGSVTSSNGHLTVLTAPVITAQPSDATVTYGNNAIFSVTATGAARFQWRHNGADIPGAISSSYTASLPKVIDSGSTYSVVVYAADSGFVISRAAMLTVNRAPLNVIADNLSRAYGAANPPLTVHYSGFVAGENQSVLSGTPSLDTTATSTSPVSGSPYPILFDGPDGQTLAAENYRFVFVNGQLTVTKANLTVTANNLVKATGAANPPLTGTVTPALLSGDNITVGYMTAATSASAAGSYPIIPTFSDPNGKLQNYNLTVNNGILTISDLPLIITQPLSITRAPIASAVATFSVQAIGSPTLTYQWKKNNQALSDIGNVSGSATATLTLTGLTAADAGSYTVSIQNSSGTTNSSAATLTLSDVAILQNPLPQFGVPGGSVFFTVGLQSVCNTPTNQWKKDGTALVNGVYWPNPTIASNIAGAASTTLTLTNIRVGAAGSYGDGLSCNQTTTNSLGGTLSICDLYPIVTGTNTVLVHKPGDSISVSFKNQPNGDSDFGWATWTGATDDPALTASFSTPNSYNYINPQAGGKPPIDVGKYVDINNGTKNNTLQFIHDHLLNQQLSIIVWDTQSSSINSPNGAYHIYSFARITITNVVVNGNNSSLVFVYNGVGRCIDQCIPPVITLPSGPMTYIEKQSPILVDTAATVVDFDSANFNGGMLTVGFSTTPKPEDAISIQNQGTGTGQIGLSTSGGVTSITYGGTSIGTVVGYLGSDLLQVAFNSSATPQAVTALLRNLTYQDTSCNVSTSDRTLQITMSDDGGCTSTPVTKTIHVTAVNDQPTLANLQNLPSIPSCGGPIQVTLSGITAGCNESQTITVSATSSRTDLLTPTVTYTSPNSTGILTLTPTGIGFGGPVTITVTVHDNGGTLNGGVDTIVKTFTVSVLDCAPVITFHSTLTFTEHNSPTVIDSLLTLTDSDSANFNGGSLTVDFSANGQPEDLLGIINGASISVVGQTVSYQGTQIGTFTGGSGSALVVTFNANATVPAVLALARSVTYYDGSDTPNLSPRTVRAVVTDGAGGVSAPTTTTITLVAVNDPPLAQPDSYSVAQGGTLTVPSLSGVLANDIDSEGDGLTAGVVTQPTHGTLTAFGNDGSFTYVQNIGTASSDTFTYRATDDGLTGGVSDPKSATATVTISIAPPACTVQTLASIQLDSASVDGGTPVVGTVTLSAVTTLAGGQVVTLTSDSPQALVPSSVLVPQGAKQASFTVQTVPVVSTGTANITASYPNQPSQMATLTITVGSSHTGGSTGGKDLLISGNNAADGNGPLQTFNFADGSLVNSFIPDAAKTSGANGRALAISGREMFYTELQNGFDPSDLIHVAPYGLNGSGGPDSRTLSSPRPTVGIQGLAFFGGALYVLTGYPNDELQVFKMDPNTGVTLAGPILVDSPAQPDSDGFTILPNGNYLINGGDRDPVYQEYNGVTGALVPGGLTIDLRTFGPSPGTHFSFGTGVTLGADGTLYFIADPNYEEFSGLQPTLVQTDLSGNLLASQPIQGTLWFEEIATPPIESFGGIICTRNDKTVTYSPMSIGAALETVSVETNVFDVRGISGNVVSAYMSRGGTATYSANNGFQVQYGVGPFDRLNGNAKVNSYPAPVTLAAATPGSSTYPVTGMPWLLDSGYLQDIQLELGGYYLTKSADRISSICGTAALTDTPQSQWPQGQNTLMFLATTTVEPQIPVGSSLDIALLETEAPQNGDWDILLSGKIVASSGNPGGWNVEMDQTPYQGAIVSVPLTATIASGYRVRTAGVSPKSAGFEVVPAGSIVRAPTLLPIGLSLNPVPAGSAVTVTVSLDEPAPPPGVVVSLNSDNPSALVPNTVTLGTGTKSQTFNISIPAGASAGTANITASYNGVRHAALRIRTGTGTPPAPPTLSATPAIGTVTLSWTSVNLVTYNVKRSRVSGGPYTTIFSGLKASPFVDTSVINGQTYYYVVSAQNDFGEGGNSGEVSATPTFGQVADPGISFDSTAQLVSFSDTTLGAVIHYTLDNSEPTEGSPVFKGSISITTTTIVKAKAFKAGYLPSNTVTQTETIPVVLSGNSFPCGTYSATEALSTSGDHSWVRGQGFNANHYQIGSFSAGNKIVIAMASVQINSYLYLFDDSGSGIPVASNDDDGTGSVNAKITFTVPSAHTYYVEATSSSSGQIGAYSLFVDCGTTPPQIGVLDTGNNSIANNATIQVGSAGQVIPGTTTTFGLFIKNVATAGTASGLNVGRLQISGDFAVDHQLIPELPPQQRSDQINVSLTTTLLDQPGAVKQGTLTIPSDDPTQNPYIIHFSSTVVSASSFPSVSITSPINNESVPDGTFPDPQSIAIQTSVTAGNYQISKVEFFAGSQKIGQATAAPYSMTWIGAAPGTYSLTAKVTDTAGRQATSSAVSITVNAPTLSGALGMTPATGTYPGSVTVTMTPDATWSANTTIIYTTDGVNWYAYHQPVVIAYNDFSGSSITVQGRGVQNGALSAITARTYTITAPTGGVTPVAQIATPAEGDQITSQVSVIGAADVQNAGDPAVTAWRLEYHVHGDDSSPWVAFATGTAAVTTGNEFDSNHKFDPTMLLNGLYDIRLTVINANGASSINQVTVSVKGDQKVGNFTLSFNDLTVPVAGIPIQVTRTYDSREKGQGDFGVGWRLDLGGIKVEKSGVLGAGWAEVPFHQGFFPGFLIQSIASHEVTVTLPGNRMYSFDTTFVPASDIFYPIRSGRVQFKAREGTYATLAPVNADTEVDVSTDPSDPTGQQVIFENSNGAFDDNEFYLTTPDGHVFKVSIASGLESITDLNGNIIQFSANGICKSTTANPGACTPILSYQRESAGGLNRITAIYVTADGPTKAVQYGYGSPGTPSALDLTTFTDRMSHQTKFVYDPLHNLIDILDPLNRHAARNTYDDQGRLIESIDALGRKKTFTFDVDQHKETVTDALGNATTLNYDERGNVTSKVQQLKLPGGGTVDVTTTSEFADTSNPDKPTTIVDPLGRKNLMSYSGNGQILSRTDPLNHTTTLSYNSYGGQLTMESATGITLSSKTYDDHGNLTLETDALGETRSTSYNSDGTLQSIQDGAGHGTTYSYGGTVDVFDPNTGNLITVTADPGGTEEPTGTTDAKGHLTQTVYDKRGNITHSVTTRTLNDGTIERIDTVNEYDENDQLTKTTVYAKVPGQALQSQVQVENTYDDLGNIATAKDMYGQQTTYTYDDMGQLINTATPDGNSVTTEYDDDGEVISTTVNSTDGKHLTTRFVFDSLGRQISTSNPDGSANYQEYDLAGQLVSSTDENGNITRYEYDDAGHKTKTIDALGHVVTYEYDANGRKVSETDANLNQIRFEYDDVGRPVKTIFPDNTSKSIGYDGLGRKVSETDQAGVQTAFTYDELGRLIAVTKAVGTADEAVTRYEFDEIGNVVKQYDANQEAKLPANRKATVFDYDFLGRRTKRTLPDGSYATATYSIVANKLRVQQTDFDAVNRHTTTLDYDVMGRPLTATPDATLPPAARVPIVLTYDPATGQRATMSDASGTTTYTYNSSGRLTQKSHSVVGSLNYTYDAVGNLLTLQSSHFASQGGVSLAYQWDKLNRLIQVDDNITGSTVKSTTYDYDTVGNLKDFIYPTATPVTTAYNYNTLNRLTDMSVTRGANAVASFNYNPNETGRTLGPIGNRRAVRESIYTATTISRSVNYDYDNCYRLMKEDIVSASGITPGVGTVDYGPQIGSPSTTGYDKVGNRRSRVISSSLGAAVPGFASVTSTFDDNDRLTSSTYDANGNTSVESLPLQPRSKAAISPDSSHKDQYDFENHLIQRSDGVSTVQIIYDGDGNRVEKIVTGPNAETRYYLVDDRNQSGYPQVVEELMPNGANPLQVTRSYTYGHSLISQHLRNGSGWDVYYYGYDGHGNVRVLMNDSGTITDTYTYDAFGILLNSTGSTANNYMYCGEQFDYDLGTYYLRSRNLNPNTARFWTMDSFEGDNNDPLSLHKYLYCYGDPVNRTDPSGKGEIIRVDFGKKWRLPPWFRRLGPVAEFYILLGLDAHVAISLDYIATHPGPGIYCNRWIKTIVGSTAPAPPGSPLRVRPDIVNNNTREVWEIKSGLTDFYAGRLLAFSEVTFYLNILNNPKYNPGRRGYHPGDSYDPTVVPLLGFIGWVMVDADEPGVLLYYFDTQSSELVALLAGLSILNPEVSEEASGIIQLEFNQETLPVEFEVPEIVELPDAA